MRTMRELAHRLAVAAVEHAGLPDTDRSAQAIADAAADLAQRVEQAVDREVGAMPAREPRAYEQRLLG